MVEGSEPPPVLSSTAEASSVDGSTFMPEPGLDDVGGDQADEQRGRGRDLEPDQGLEPDPAEGLQVTGLGDADDDHAEHERRDHRLDETDETVAERLEGRGRVGPQPSDDDSEHERAGDLREQ